MNKRGHAIVESAIIFPVVIMVVMALIYMMIYFYGQLCSRTDMHMMLRSESGKMCENMYYKNEIESSFSVYEESQQLYSGFEASMNRTGILKKRKKDFVSRKYIIDEVKYVRMGELLDNGIMDEDE